MMRTMARILEKGVVDVDGGDPEAMPHPSQQTVTNLFQY